MARPRKGMEKARPKHLGFRVATWVHDAVHRLAAEQDQPASEIAHELLEIALGRLGITPPHRIVGGTLRTRARARVICTDPTSDPRGDAQMTPIRLRSAHRHEGAQCRRP
jgi:hypothetical protein